MHNFETRYNRVEEFATSLRQMENLPETEVTKETRVQLMLTLAMECDGVVIELVRLNNWVRAHKGKSIPKTEMDALNERWQQVRNSEPDSLLGTMRRMYELLMYQVKYQCDIGPGENRDPFPDWSVDVEKRNRMTRSTSREGGPKGKIATKRF